MISLNYFGNMGDNGNMETGDPRSVGGYVKGECEWYMLRPRILFMIINRKDMLSIHVTPNIFKLNKNKI